MTLMKTFKDQDIIQLDLKGPWNHDSYLTEINCFQPYEQSSQNVFQLNFDALLKKMLHFPISKKLSFLYRK